MRTFMGALAASGLVAIAAAQACQQGVHVIVARASGEPVGFGGLVILKNLILQQIPNSDAIAVPYPASIGGAILYTTSEPEGVGNATNLIKQYGDACPDNKMVLMGYSQGAQVMADALLGIDFDKFPAFGMTQGLEQKYIDQVVAVIMMGDPSNVAGNPVLYGTAKHSGFFPRNNTAKWAETGLVNKTRSYCDANDFFCDKGNSIQVHVGYVAEYGTQAVKYVVDHWKASQAESTDGSGISSVSSAGGPGGVPSTAGPSATTSVPDSSATGAAATPTQASSSSAPAGTGAGAAATPTPSGTGAAASLKAASLGNVVMVLLSCALAAAI